MANDIIIIPYDDDKHRNQTIRLWNRELGYGNGHNRSELAIDNKIKSNDCLFFVAEKDQKLAGTILGGYDGHRGWVYSLAVQPELRKKGIGSKLLRHLEKHFAALGCVKINLQINFGNEDVVAFYRKNGYDAEERISMGKKLPENF